MPEQPDFITVFRSADVEADLQAGVVQKMLAEAGLSALVFDDSAEDVPEGACEVRVPAHQVEEAEALIAAAEGSGSLLPLDTSHAKDLVTIFYSDRPDAEMEALAVRSLLVANQVDAVIVGSFPIPSLAFEVRVPRDEEERARQVIEDAKAGGPLAAEEAEAATEGEDQFFGAE